MTSSAPRLARTIIFLTGAALEAYGLYALATFLPRLSHIPLKIALFAIAVSALFCGVGALLLMRALRNNGWFLTTMRTDADLDVNCGRQIAELTKSLRR